MNEKQRIAVICALFFMILFMINRTFFIPRLKNDIIALECQSAADGLSRSENVQSSIDSTIAAQTDRILKLEGRLGTAFALGIAYAIGGLLSIISAFVLRDKKHKGEEEWDDDEWDEENEF